MSEVSKLINTSTANIAKVSGQAVATVAKRTTIEYPLGYVQAAIDIFDAMTLAGSTPTDGRKVNINTFVETMQDDGLWAKHDVIWFPATHAQVCAPIDWISQTYSLVENNTPTWNIDQGYKGNGANMYLNTQFNPFTDGVNYSLNSACMWMYVRNSISEVKYTMGAGVASNYVLILPYTGSTMNCYINSNNPIAKTVTSSQGLSAINRNSLTIIEAYRNGTSLGTSLESSIQMPNTNAYILAYSNNGTPTLLGNVEVAAAGFCSSLDATEHADLFTNVETYLDAIGAGVIP